MGLRAQSTITNSDFELWSYGKPVNWTVALQGNITSFINIPVEVSFGSQSSDAHSGNSAVKLQSADFSIPYTQYNFNIPGILQAGESEGFAIPLEDILAIIQAFQDTANIGNFDPSTLASLTSLIKMLSPGVPCSAIPGAVTAWVKYQPQENDQMLMFAIAKSNGVPVGYAYDSFNPSVPNTYQQIAIGFDNAGEPCDSIMIVLLSSMQLGSSSVLYVDDIALVNSGTGIASHDRSNSAIYPNPATDNFHIRPTDNTPYRWSLSDLTGKILQNGEAVGETSVDTRHCAPGIYLLQTNRNGQIRTSKVIIR